MKALYGVMTISGVPVLASGCSSGSDPGVMPEPIGRTIQPIIFGAASGSEHDAVVVLTTFRGGQRRSFCTATLVAPNLIVSARHCVSDTDTSTACSKEGVPIAGATVKGDRSPEDLVVFVGNEGSAPDTTMEANASARGQQIVVDSSTTLCNHDLAFVVLDRELEAPLAPLRLGPPRGGETIAAVGWGIDETGKLPATREVRADVPLVGIGPAVYPDNERYGYGDAEFMVGESACSGDSGSPAFVKSGAIIGVAARAGNGKPRDPTNYASVCMGDTAHAIYTHFSGHVALVVRAFQEAGARMWLESEPDPRVQPSPEPEPARTASPVSASAPEEEAPATSPATPGEDVAVGGGCSMATEPKRGAVEYAAGFVALLASIASLRRRFGRRGEERVEGNERHPARSPSMP